LLRSRREEKEARAATEYAIAHDTWKATCARSAKSHEERLADYGSQMESYKQSLELEVRAWEDRRQEFLDDQARGNAAIDHQRSRYESREPEAIEAYCDMVLAASDYPDCLPAEADLSFQPETGILVVAYTFPALAVLPKVREVTYVQARDEFVEKELSAPQLNALYDSLLYQITLRTIHELFEADQVQAIQAVVFNGYVTSIDPRSGLSATACVLSLQVNRNEFLGVNLAQVDPKLCFKALRGVGSSKLHSLTPVAPILELRREDGRFVSAREVASTLDSSLNLASMDWEDFEHLIRELFEQEFRASGGEVRVTQASRDGGVDAIAFDPDPIRGGKIIIQAKRYTNTVGVSAVRDLFGTVLNEGATKGILVTTSDYGPDAYGFAKDKPLTLLNGGNLLHLLEKHGHRARIDLREAREQARLK
jgi:restriction system protein